MDVYIHTYKLVQTIHRATYNIATHLIIFLLDAYFDRSTFKIKFLIILSIHAKFQDKNSSITISSIK